MNIQKHIPKIIAVIISVSIIGYFMHILMPDNEILDHSIELIFELFTVFIISTIFAVAWYSYNKSRDNHVLFIGVAFAIVGTMDLLHTLSYPFMPVFITPNTFHKSMVFWTFGRVLFYVTFLLSAYVYKNTLPAYINKRVLFLSGSVLIIVLSITGVYYHNYIPKTISGEAFTPLRIIYILITAAIIVYASYRYTKRPPEYKNELYLIYGLVLVYFSDIMYVSFDMSAHLLKAVGYIYVFVSVYRSSVEEPYEKLAVAEEKLRHSAEIKYESLFDNANDAIVTIDTEGKITSWNHAAESMFGWKSEEIIENKLSDTTVPADRLEEYSLIFKSLISGEKEFVDVETVRMRKDGTELYVRVMFSPLQDMNESISGFSIIIRDISEHKKYEASLRKSKEFVETVLNSMNDEVSIIDVHNYRIVDANKVFLDTYGLSKDEVVGKTCYEITHNRDSPCTPPDEPCPLIETLETGKHSVFEHVHYAKGEKHYVEVSTSPVFDEKGELIQIVHVSRDITDHKLAEMALRESENELRAITSIAPDAIIHMNANGKIVLWNYAAERMFGYTPEEAIGKELHEVMAPKKYHKAYIKGLRKFKETGQGFAVGKTLEFTALKKNGMEFPIEVAFSSFKLKNEWHAVGIIRDITERKLAETALKDSEEKFRSMAQTAIDAVIISDENSNIIEWNKSAEKIFQYTEKEILGKPLTIIMPERYREAHTKGMKRIVEGKKPKYTGKTIELYGLRKDGSEFPVELSVAGWKTEKGMFFGGMLHDITERKHAEGLRLENVRLTLADRAKSEFLSVMSHELRTPLNATIGFSELLKDGKAGKLNEKQEHFVDNIIRSGRHLLELIEDILDLTKIEAGKMELRTEKVSIPAIIDETLPFIKVLANKQNVVIKKEIDPQLELIDGDAQKIKQILLNLLNNAVKYSKDDGGIVTITTRKEGDMASISVSDTGIGIKEEDMHRLFRDFEQLDTGTTRKYGGTGLGLSISKKLAELHGGTISVKSEYGAGTTFTITLPIVAEKHMEN